MRGSWPPLINCCKNRLTRRIAGYVRSRKELKKSLGGRKTVSGKGRGDVEPSSRQFDCWDPGIPVKSPVEDDVQVF